MEKTPAVEKTPAEEKVSVVTVEGRPVEFIWRGRRWRIHSILTRFKKAGGWWTRPAIGGHPDDGEEEIWQVEAAPEGALGLFHLTIDQRTGKWSVGNWSSEGRR